VKRKDVIPVRIEQAWPAIVDPKTFREAQYALQKRSPRLTRPRTIASNYLLSGIMRCAECGAALTGAAAKSGKFFYYRCNNALRRGPEACRSRWLPKSKIEGFIVDRVKGYILTDENLVELIRLTNQEIALLASSEGEKLDYVSAQLVDTEMRLERLYDALETGKLPLDDLASRIDNLVARKAELERTKMEIQSAARDGQLQIKDLETMRGYVEDLRDVLGSGSPAEQKFFIRSFVESIEVSNTEVKVNYTLPIPQSDTSSESIGVLAFGRYGSPHWKFRTGV